MTLGTRHVLDKVVVRWATEVTMLRKMRASPLGKEKQTPLEHLVLFDIFSCDAEGRARSAVISIDVSRFMFENTPCLRSTQ